MSALLLAAEALVAGWSRPVVGPCSLALARGEIVALCGPNGAGKSTLLAALAGSARRFAGRVTQAPGLRLALQTQARPPVDGVPFSGADLLALTGAPARGLPARLAGRLGERLDRLSGGQCQFLHLWSCLAAPLDVVLLDEPGNHLDPEGCDDLVEALRARAAAGLGILLVSHDDDFVARVAQRTVRLPAARSAEPAAIPAESPGALR